METEVPYKGVPQVPKHVRKRFVDLGAVEARMQNTDILITDLVYFFDDDGREVGYWTTLQQFSNDEPTIFLPNHRTWHPQYIMDMTSCFLADDGDILPCTADRPVRPVSLNQ